MLDRDLDDLDRACDHHDHQGERLLRALRAASDESGVPLPPEIGWADAAVGFAASGWHRAASACDYLAARE